MELLVLRAMCQGTAQGSVRAIAAQRLARYVWREPVHQAMFECLVTAPSDEASDLRECLLACLTRKGFPDVDLEVLFEPHGLTMNEAVQLLQRLIQGL